jgi:MFS family permease
MVGVAEAGLDSSEQRLKLDGARSWYVLTFLTLAYALAYIDRQMLNLVVDPIKRSLLISDTHFSLIQGTAFVSAYLLAAPVFGRLVDVSNRRNILIFGVCTWSIFTALCGKANSFPELFIARFGVGVSEACVFPVSMSLIADYFSTRQAPRALSVLTLGSQLGGGFSLVASGLVIAFAGRLRLEFPSLVSLETWQMAFVVIGLPGLVFAALLLTIREPRRSQFLASDAADQALTGREVAARLWAQRHFYGRIYLAIGMIGIIQLGIPTWFPSFLIRAHAMPPAEAGYRLGTLSVVLGSIGPLAGAAVAQWLEKRGHRDALLRVAAFATIGMLLSCAAIPIASSAVGALGAAAGMIFWCGFPTGIIASATQLATPSRMRGVVASLYTFSAQLIGYGLGPTVVALFTDRVFADPKMVGYSLQIVMCTAATLAAFLLFSVLPHYRVILGGLAEPSTLESSVGTGNVRT